MKHRIGVLVLSLAVGLSLPQAAWAATFEALLLGSNEVPGPGTTDASALALVVVDGTKVTLSIESRGLQGEVAAHIHKGRSGVAGRLVVGFPWSPFPDSSSGQPSTATTTFFGSLPAKSAADLVANPQNYYVHIHTPGFPAGACRGQLHPRSERNSAPVAGPALSAGAGGLRAPEPPFPPPPWSIPWSLLEPQMAPRHSAVQAGGLAEGVVQTISFPSPSPRTYGDPGFQLDASASSGLPVTFTAWGDCDVDGSYVRILAAGDCWVEAQQPGDSRFAAAPVVDRQFPIARADQTISFSDLGDALPAGFVITLRVSASSGLPVDLSARGACLLSRVTSTLSGLGVGTCSVVAEQPGDSNFNAAPSVTLGFTVLPPIFGDEND